MWTNVSGDPNISPVLLWLYYHNIAYFSRNCLEVPQNSLNSQIIEFIHIYNKEKWTNCVSAFRTKMCLKESPTMLTKYHKNQQIHNSEQCQWPRAFLGLWTSMYLICPHLHNCCSVSVAGSVGRLWLCRLNWSWRHAPESSERIEPDSQSVAGKRLLVVLVVTQCTWAVVGRHRAGGPNGRPRCPLRSWNTGHLWFGRRKHWRPDRLSKRMRQAEIRVRGYSLDSGWDYWRPHGLHYLSQHHAIRTRLRETEDLKWSAGAAAATAENKVILEDTVFLHFYTKSSPSYGKNVQKDSPQLLSISMLTLLLTLKKTGYVLYGLLNCWL